MKIWITTIHFSTKTESVIPNRARQTRANLWHFSKIFGYDKDHDLPIAQYMRFSDDTDPSEFNTDDCAYYSSKGCKLDVVELN